MISCSFNFIVACSESSNCFSLKQFFQLTNIPEGSSTYPPSLEIPQVTSHQGRTCYRCKFLVTATQNPKTKTPVLSQLKMYTFPFSYLVQPSIAITKETNVKLTPGVRRSLIRVGDSTRDCGAPNKNRCSRLQLDLTKYFKKL